MSDLEEIRAAYRQTIVEIVGEKINTQEYMTARMGLDSDELRTFLYDEVIFMTRVGNSSGQNSTALNLMVVAYHSFVLGFMYGRKEEFINV